MALIIREALDAGTPDEEAKNPRYMRLILERSTYIRADKEAGTKPGRSVGYIGTLRAHIPLNEVDKELLAKLSFDEKQKLAARLSSNEPTKYEYLDEATRLLNEATKRIKKLKNAEDAKPHVRALADAWDAFDAAAKGVGAKRTKKSPKGASSDPRQASLPGA